MSARTGPISVTVPGSEPKVAFSARPAAVPDTVKDARDAKARLAGTIRLELTYARTRQFDQFLTGPDPTGHSSTAYLYRTAARAAAPSAIEESGSDSHTMGWVALGLLLVAGLPLAAVLWARS